MLRTLPAEDPTVGDRAVTTELTLVEILAGLAADRERLVLVTRAGGDTATGALRSGGQELDVLRTDAPPPAHLYVPLHRDAHIHHLSFNPTPRTYSEIDPHRKRA